VSDLRKKISVINDATIEVKESEKLRQIMQTILTLGNALNQLETFMICVSGSAVGFKLDSLLKLSHTRARNNKMTLMHYLCKLLSEKMPEVLDFDKDMIPFKDLAKEVQEVSEGLKKVEQELTALDNDGAIFVGFQKGRNGESLSQYFGEDPVRCHLSKEAKKENSSGNKKEGVDVDSKKDLRNMIRDTSLSIEKLDTVS
ncbi:formin-like protein 14, partial [Tanacetum coccineum]